VNSRHYFFVRNIINPMPHHDPASGGLCIDAVSGWTITGARAVLKKAFRIGTQFAHSNSLLKNIL
jgi:hypothetical protein